MKTGKPLDESSKGYGSSGKDVNSPLQPSPKTVSEAESQKRDPFESVWFFPVPRRHMRANLVNMISCMFQRHFL